MALTPPQRGVLSLVVEHGTVVGSNHTGPTRPCVLNAVADRLVDRGLLERVEWNGSAWLYRATDAGREALA